MNDVSRYRLQKLAWLKGIKKPRATCGSCLKPLATCYCREIEKIPTPIKFAILIHPLEARRAIATGRMAHLCLLGSSLIRGLDFSKCEELNNLLNNPQYFAMILFPGETSTRLDQLSLNNRQSFVPKGLTPLVLVIDGTWRTANKMLRLNPQLVKLPRISFLPSKISSFQVRKQPRDECFSTLEAIAAVLNLFGVPGGESLLKPFHYMNAQQLKFMAKPHPRVRIR